ncbi:Hypothetical predicted protein [Octopus vulgaris]|uniref:Uncharacterized protein n=1 Tax=Octopus vulgaris TaxID=6645 RepID=A0AA36F5D2_OCTVU|nr:Hypothetical predicted protein [Octopus vulgaris]
MDSVEARTGSQTGEEEILLALIIGMLRGQITQTNAFLERMDKRRQGLRADQQELEVGDGSALKDRCWTGDRDGPVGEDCPSNEVKSEECGLGGPCEAGPEVDAAETKADVAESDVEKPEEPAECVLSAAIVPCLEPLASRPLSLGTQDEQLVKSRADVAESKEPAVCVVAAAVDVPCLSPLVSGPLSLGAQKDCMVPTVERPQVWMDCRTSVRSGKPSVQELVAKRTKPGGEARRRRTVKPVTPIHVMSILFTYQRKLLRRTRTLDCRHM